MTFAYFFGFIFFTLIISDINLYGFQHKSIGINIFVSSIMNIVFGTLMVGSYAIMAGKVYVKGNIIRIKKRYCYD